VFEDEGLNRLGAFCLVGNAAGMRVLEKAGMTKEGVLREYAFQKGAFRDFCVFSVLVHGWWRVRSDDWQKTDSGST
jgi:ribosomal-protein-alanine N-acetyltransferase